jgi:hypothetical protein
VRIRIKVITVAVNLRAGRRHAALQH